MVKMNSQTKIIVFTAVALTAVDLSARYWMMRTMTPTAPAGVVTAREIRLVDNNGNLRAQMTTDENSEAGLVMFDRNNVKRLQLDTWDNIPSLILHRDNGQRATYYGMEPDGQAHLDMLGDHNNVLATMGTVGGSPTVFTNREDNIVIESNHTGLTIR